jgi:glycosyltransferase involved in cell wall biosynthesis
MIETHEHPLITFGLFAYKQERFIREAVQGAFNQEYSPLEIVLSDDCSCDGTFEVMRNMAGGYHGPHKIILNRNPSNLGVGGHVNRVVELSTGPLIIEAAGDDISHPHRVRYLCEEWLKQGRQPTSLHSDYEVMDDQGTLIKDTWERNSFSGKRSVGLEEVRSFLNLERCSPQIHGATHAFGRDLFLEFGPLNNDVFYEDKVLSFRSLLIGSFAYVPRKLVRYRTHSGNLWGRAEDPHASRCRRIRQGLAIAGVRSRRWLSVMNNFSDDVRTLERRGRLAEPEGTALTAEIDRCIQLQICDERFYSGPPWTALFALVRRLKMKPQWRYGWEGAKHLLFRTADFIGVLPR